LLNKPDVAGFRFFSGASGEVSVQVKPMKQLGAIEPIADIAWALRLFTSQAAALIQQNSITGQHPALGCPARLSFQPECGQCLCNPASE
jgi:hypothetical protein